MSVNSLTHAIFLIFFLFLSKKKKCFSTVYYSRFIVTQDYAAQASDIKLAHCQQLVHQLQVHSLVGVAHFRQPLCPGAALLPPASLATLDALVCVPNQQIQASSMPGSGAACPAQTCVETFLNAYRPAQHFLAQPRGAHVYGFVNKAPHARHQHANLWAQAASPVLHIHIATTFTLLLHLCVLTLAFACTQPQTSLLCFNNPRDGHVKHTSF